MRRWLKVAVGAALLVSAVFVLGISLGYLHVDDAPQAVRAYVRRRVGGCAPKSVCPPPLLTPQWYLSERRPGWARPGLHGEESTEGAHRPDARRGA